MRSLPKVLVVVPTLNEAPHIRDILERLVAEVDELDLRVVVADGGSSDGTCELVEAFAARHPCVRLLHNPARIQSAAVNAAVRRFGQAADVLIRCDAHAAYPERFCARLVGTLQQVGADAVVVPLDSQGLTPFQRAVAWVSNSVVGSGGSAHRAGQRSGFVDHGHHAAFRLEMFRAAGGYDETFTHNEDAELDCRQRALGARIYLDATIRVGYRPRASVGALFRQYFNYGAGRSRTLRRHPSSLRGRQLAVPLHVLALGLSFASCWWSRWALAWPAAYLGALLSFSLWLWLERRQACAFYSGLAALVMHCAWGFGFLVGLLRRREGSWGKEMLVPLSLGGANGEGA